MIEYLTRNKLDEKKFDECIGNASNSRIYAYSWYLDIVCDDWDVLIKDNYKWVMPLPKRKKMGVSYIYQAPWVQQLGVFSMEKIDREVLGAFVNAIPKKFKLIDVFLNSENTSTLKVTIRDNYFLPLNKRYEELKKEYSKGRKSSVKHGYNSNLKIIDNYDQYKIIQLFKKNKGVELDRKDSDYDILHNLVRYALPLNYVQSLGVVNNNNELIGGAFFLRDSNRITYLFSALNSEGRVMQAMSFLIDYVIHSNANSQLILDFEGSMIRDLASFFKSFGAKKEAYFHLKQNRLPKILRALNK